MSMTPLGRPVVPEVKIERDLLRAAGDACVHRDSFTVRRLARVHRDHVLGRWSVAMCALQSLRQTHRRDDGARGGFLNQ
jgi:hypothetical protein